MLLLYNSFIELVSLGSGRSRSIRSGGSPSGGCYTVFSHLEVIIIVGYFVSDETTVYNNIIVPYAGLPLRQQANPRGEKIKTVISACYYLSVLGSISSSSVYKELVCFCHVQFVLYTTWTVCRKVSLLWIQDNSMVEKLTACWHSSNVNIAI